jgi:hypothetical protein
MHARLTALARLTFGNRPAQAYLALVAVAAVHVAVDTAFAQHADASFAGVWLFFLAAPAIFGLLAAGMFFGDSSAESAAFLYPALVLAVLVQALALGAFTRLLKDGTAAARPRGV